MHWVEWVVFVVIAAFLLMAIVFAGRAMYVDMKCTEAGYPTAKTTIKLDGYCMALDGAVTVKVDKLK